MCFSFNISSSLFHLSSFLAPVEKTMFEIFKDSSCLTKVLLSCSLLHFRLLYKSILSRTAFPVTETEKQGSG